MHPVRLHHRLLASQLFMLAAIAIFAFSTPVLAQSSDAPSLGDLARKQREKQQQSKNPAAKPKKVVTEEDMPSHPTSDADETLPRNGSHDETSVQQSASDVFQNGEQLKSAISRQKALVADLKSRIDKVNSSIHFVEANAYRNGVEYNKLQAQKQEEVERLRGQLSEQQRDLEQMQEKARKAGYGSAVWDPE